jgi:hypothetical protein
MRTLQIDDATYNLAPLTVDQAEEIFTPEIDPKQSTRLVIAACTGMTSEAVGALPYSHYRKLVGVALELNGLSDAKGEATAAV